MTFPQVPIDQITPSLRSKIETIDALGGDTRFFRFAAHAPHIVELYWGHFYRDVFFKGLLPVRLKEIARLRLAALNGCSFCQVGDRQSAIDHGVTEAEVDALFADGQAPSFSAAEQAAADTATRLSNFDPEGTLEAPLLDRLHASFMPAELMELLTAIGLLTGMARMLLGAGFISRTCAIDDASAPARAHG
ncbi:MAG: carboxymuconolactone decarboxylase family protein [Gammaproteobacteria bacterium]|nr:carboxymuconolactone decarboxylase family protein [Gammaproteobacteria bacterium]MBU1444018.1 carboxymuconolactone decarboxylase family protein [Gammaproteobacteria bacterium]MBU2286224.1 carboxymuconolactone decarboxylase family protein [Gammaproteobacteria bacterium]